MLMIVTVSAADEHCRDFMVVDSLHSLSPVGCGPLQSMHMAFVPGEQSRRSCSPPQRRRIKVSLQDRAKWPATLRHLRLPTNDYLMDFDSRRCWFT